MERLFEQFAVIDVDTPHHRVRRHVDRRGDTAEAGCGDVCVVWDGGVDALLELLARQDVTKIEGPVPRRGGRDEAGTLGISVYVRDPDRNLLEFISYDPRDIERYGRGGHAV